MLTMQDLENQEQLICDDLDCILDGLDDNFITNVHQVIVDRFAMLKDKMEPNYLEKTLLLERDIANLQLYLTQLQVKVKELETKAHDKELPYGY